MRVNGYWISSQCTCDQKVNLDGAFQARGLVVDWHTRATLCGSPITQGRYTISPRLPLRRHLRWGGAVALCFFAIGSAWAIGAKPDVTAGDFSTDVTLLIVYVLLALIFSFMCSVAEAALLSITPSFIAGLREENPRMARRLKRLKQDNIDQSLAAILTLNTIAHTVGAIGSGAKATAVFGSAWFGVFSAVMTLLILFLSEIVPKTLGAVYWPQLAGVTAHFVRGLILVLYPLIWVSEGLTKLIARGKSVHAFSREEFIAMAGLGEQHGHIKESESRIIRNLLRFESLKARDIMTPRTVMQAHSQDMTVAEALADDPDPTFSRLPIFDLHLDSVSGFVLKDDLLLAQAQGDTDKRLSQFKRNIATVAESMPLSDLLDKLLERKEHIALVIDEYGGTAGLVTLEDVVETLLGMEIVDEADEAVDMQQLARQQWQRRAEALGLNLDSLDQPTGVTDAAATQKPKQS